MSSKEFQIIKMSQRTKEINTRQNTSKVLQYKISYQKVIPTTVKISKPQLSKPVSTFISRRELNQSSPVYTGGMNQLPVRTNVVNSIGNEKVQKEKKINNNEPRSITNKVSLVKKERYKSTKEQKDQQRYEISGNRRNTQMTLGSNNNLYINTNTSNIRSKSSNIQSSQFLKDFIKQGENITEKMYPGKNNKLVIETRKVEVFKNMNLFF